MESRCKHEYKDMRDEDGFRIFHSGRKGGGLYILRHCENCGKTYFKKVIKK